MLAKRDGLGLRELSIFELYMELIEQGWRCELAKAGNTTKKDRERMSYKVGSDKVFWIKDQTDAATRLHRLYMLALLFADQHKQQVPAFRASYIYEAIIDGKDVATAKRSRTFMKKLTPTHTHTPKTHTYIYIYIHGDNLY